MSFTHRWIHALAALSLLAGLTAAQAAQSAPQGNTPLLAGGCHVVCDPWYGCRWVCPHQEM